MFNRSIEMYPDDRFPVKCWQVEWEFEELLKLYFDDEQLSVLEVGCYHGGTLYNWAIGNPRRIVVVDTFAAADNRPLFREWAKRHDFELIPIEGNSLAASTVLRAKALGPYDWLHIDADHTYESAKSDFENYAPMVKPGGVVVLHDINPREGYGVSRLWREIQAAGYTTREIVADPNSGLCGIGVILDWPGALITE